MTLRIAARRLGGTHKLGQLLGVSSDELASWLFGRAEPPRELFLRALECILDDLDVESNVGPTDDCARRPELKVLRNPGQSD